MIEIVNIGIDGEEKLNQFLAGAGDSLNTFRYFRNRTIKALEAHIITALVLQDGTPVAYGHLDKEGEVVWLGIAVVSHARGGGFGKMMMDYLINKASEYKLPKIRLSVDRGNFAAIGLYHDFGFLETMDCSGEILYLERQF